MKTVAKIYHVIAHLVPPSGSKGSLLKYTGELASKLRFFLGEDVELATTETRDHQLANTSH